MSREDEFDGLEGAMDSASAGANVLGQDLERLREEFAKAAQASGDFSVNFQREISGAIRAVVVDGKSLSDTFRNLALSMADKVFSAAINPLASMASSVIGSALGFANGGVIEHGNVTPFARGGVLNSPGFFPLNHGMGLAGEAGPEAIMPLTRGADGKLGVAAAAGNKNVNVTFNISTPDVEGFRKSQSQIAAQLQRAISSGEDMS